MPTAVWTRIVIGLSAALALVFALLTGASINATTLLKSLSAASSGVVILLLVYERWAWRFWPFRLLSNRPILHGTWRGTLESSWEDPGTGERVPPKDVFIVIRQTYSTVAVTMLFDISHSYSMSANLLKQNDRFVLAYMYRSEAETLQQQMNPPHRGGAALFVSIEPSVSFEGDYWTERMTKGRIRSTGRSSTTYDAYREAQMGTYT